MGGIGVERKGVAGCGWHRAVPNGSQLGAPLPEELAPADASKGLEIRRSTDPGLVEAAVPAPMLAYRCVRSLSRSFGVDDPALILPGPHRIPGYLVCVHGQNYISPLILASACDGRSGGAVLELHLPIGVPALWVAGSGDPSTVNGADLICLDHVLIELTGHRLQNSVPILEFDVLVD